MIDYSKLRKVPLLRILFPFILGILFTSLFFFHIDCVIRFIYIVLFILLTASLIVLFINPREKIFDYLLFGLIFIIGMVYSHASLKTPSIEQKEKFYHGIVCEVPQLKKNSSCFAVQLDRNQFPDLTFQEPKMFLYTTRDSLLVDSVCIGKKIIFYGKLNPIKNLGNPGEFDFKKYLSTKYILFQSYVPLSRLDFSTTNHGFFLKRFASDVCKKIIHQLQNYSFNDNSFAILLALIAGNRDFISDDLEKSYVNAGVVHVLSVSGLHVGIIFMFLQVLLKFLDYHKRTRFFKVIFILLIIWIYALISGLSPSVMRAALMFSLITVGQSTQRDISPFNILALSALIMLIINPLQIYDVGFQLSYLAVFGILYFQPVFDSWFTAQNRVVDYVYKLFSVSLAAQLSTIPFILFYFNQFASYFWLANLLVIPLSFVILILAIIFICISGISAVSGLLGWVLNVSTYLMNSWIKLIEQIPGSVIHDIHFPGLFVVISFVFIFSLFSWIKKPQAIKLYFVLLSLSVFLLFGIFRNTQKINKNMVVVYNIPKYSSIAIYSDSLNCVIGNYEMHSVPGYVQEIYRRHRQIEDIDKKMEYYRLDSIFADSDSGFFNNQKSVSVITVGENSKIMFYPGNRFEKQIFDIKAEYLIVSGNKYPPSAPVFANSIILDSSNKMYIEQYWETYCRKWSKNIVIVRKQGAYKIEIDKI